MLFRAGQLYYYYDRRYDAPLHPAVVKILL
ncbi:hypothetical protein H206_05165 [Candidatus Electrothrix aarhusensis]|uniref:Uncharacterized protein n=1 Tax=Candidatus Electrothrix aarhusensis TaxID=1859131 RepID=A0A444J595_9BACT|nr:hypothetical protein H206_05165 [Candidatus Electrothrix aarhusensis]